MLRLSLFPTLRRAVQTACLIIFLLLFFYVCWPYAAQPARVWNDWLPIEVDAATGRATLEAEHPPDEMIGADAVVHVVDQSSSDGPYLGAFRVVQAPEGQLILEPVERLTPDQLDAVSMSFGPWSLHEKSPDAWPAHYADHLQSRERVEAELFLALDPLVGISTALAGRTWVWSLAFAAVALAVCIVVPRGFCGYVCPMGTLIDLFDWTLSRRLRRSPSTSPRWWTSIKYGLLAATLAAALCGTMIAGFVAAIPVVTRAMMFVLSPLQTGILRGWHQVPPIGPGDFFSIGLFVFVLGLGLVRPRFWCKYVCPTGALFSLGTLLRLVQRKVKPNCTACGKCVAVCSFDAIETDFTTRTIDCTFCQTCGGVCPFGAIAFTGRWSNVPAKTSDHATVEKTSVGRRRFLATAVGITAGSGGGLAAAAFGLSGSDTATMPPVRPPGSVPEPLFLQLCVRCGECYQVCPNHVLQPLGFEQGFGLLWTPQVAADWAGCEASCNNCGQVCPTGAIRALAIEEKKAARIGLAVVDEKTCLPYAGREECRLCVDECTAAGYRAMEFQRVGTEVDASGNPIEGSGFVAPVVLAEACVGCGLCQTRCHGINVKEKGLLETTAIRIKAGPGNEDRLTTGSYVALREEERRKREEQQLQTDNDGGGYLPDFLD